jgi:hypothetical protein
MERGWREVAQYDVNLEIGGTNVAQNDNYPHSLFSCGLSLLNQGLQGMLMSAGYILLSFILWIS